VLQTGEKLNGPAGYGGGGKTLKSESRADPRIRSKVSSNDGHGPKRRREGVYLLGRGTGQLWEKPLEKGSGFIPCYPGNKGGSKDGMGGKPKEKKGRGKES